MPKPKYPYQLEVFFIDDYPEVKRVFEEHGIKVRTYVNDQLVDDEQAPASKGQLIRLSITDAETERLATTAVDNLASRRLVSRSLP